MTDTALTPVRRQVTVPASPARAFRVFTTYFDAWWPRGHHISAAELRTAIIEPRVGGRWYEIDVDGDGGWRGILAGYVGVVSASA